MGHESYDDKSNPKGHKSRFLDQVNSIVDSSCANHEYGCLIVFFFYRQTDAGCVICGSSEARVNWLFGLPHFLSYNKEGASKCRQ